MAGIQKAAQKNYFHMRHLGVMKNTAGGSDVSESIQEKTVGSTGNVEIKADRISYYLVAKAQQRKKRKKSYIYFSV